MAYFNPMERIRKHANFPNLAGGVPPKSHRKCSDWAAYTEAVDNVTREMVADITACKESYAELAGKASEQASRLAKLHEQLAKIEKEKIAKGIESIALRNELPPAQREQLIGQCS